MLIICAYYYALLLLLLLCIFFHIISTDEDPGLRIESFAVINLRGVSTNKTITNTDSCRNSVLPLHINAEWISNVSLDL